MALVMSREASVGLAWHDDIPDWPNADLTVLWDAARKAALEWIEENNPAHHARDALLKTPSAR